MSASIQRRGLMLVLSSPSGAGKSTISRALLASDANLSMSVSVTTRKPRPGEVDGKDYFFVSVPEYERMVRDNEFLEHAKVFDNLYGTPRAYVQKVLSSGKDILFDIDWQGTQKLTAGTREDVVTIFILPPSHDELDRRLRARAQDSDEVVRGRMARASDEMSHFAEYDYVVINTEIEKSIEQVRTILAAERLRRSRQPGLVDFVNQLRGMNQRLSTAFANPQNCCTVSVSARAVGSTPAASQSAIASPPRDFRLCRSILRRWPKAAAVTRSSVARLAGASGAGRGCKVTTLESTCGGGVKARGLTSKAIATSHSHCAMMLTRP